MNIKKKSLTRFFTLAVLILSGVYIALSTAYNLIAQDFVLASTFSLLLDVIYHLTYLLNLCTYAVCFAIFIYSISRVGVKKSLPIVFIYGGILLAKSLVDTTVGHLIFMTGWTLEGLLYLLVIWLLFEMSLAFGVVLISHLCMKSADLGELSFDKLYSSENALQKSALFVSLLITSTKLISQIIYDIGYGAPADIIDLLWMIALYLSSIISGVIVYIISFFVMKRLYKSENI